MYKRKGCELWTIESGDFQDIAKPKKNGDNKYVLYKLTWHKSINLLEQIDIILEIGDERILGYLDIPSNCIGENGEDIYDGNSFVRYNTIFVAVKYDYLKGVKIEKEIEFHSLRNDEYIFELNQSVVDEYVKHYFKTHKRAKNHPLEVPESKKKRESRKKERVFYPFLPSLNQWFILQRFTMNALKQKWKDFWIWFVEKKGWGNLELDQVEMKVEMWAWDNRGRDVDNYASSIKFVLDGLVEAGFLKDDNWFIIPKESFEFKGVDGENPRMLFRFLKLRG